MEGLAIEDRGAPGRPEADDPAALEIKERPGRDLADRADHRRQLLPGGERDGRAAFRQTRQLPRHARDHMAKGQVLDEPAHLAKTRRELAHNRQGDLGMTSHQLEQILAPKHQDGRGLDRLGAGGARPAVERGHVVEGPTRRHVVEDLLPAVLGALEDSHQTRGHEVEPVARLAFPEDERAPRAGVHRHTAAHRGQDRGRERGEVGMSTEHSEGVADARGGTMETLHHHHTGATATGTLRHEHEVVLRALALLERLAQEMDAGGPADRSALEWLIAFFKTFADRCHHFKEEQHLFPALERRGIPRDGGPVGVMLAEHEEGRALLRAMRPEGGRETAEAIRAYAKLLRAHIDKENGVLFLLADHVLSAEDHQRLLAAFAAVEAEVVGPDVHERLLADLDRLERAAAGEPPAAGDAVLDVRAMSPRERHPRIFATFERLGRGESFVLVNDHDPKPLYYQFAAERQGMFSWQYLEEGPEVWRVAIGKTSA